MKKKSNISSLQEDDKRSEKIKEILNSEPSFLIRWGTIFVFLIFACVLIIMIGSMYPYGHGETIFEHITEKIKYIFIESL